MKFVYLTIKKAHEAKFDFPITLFNVENGAYVYVIKDDYLQPDASSLPLMPETGRNLGGIDFRNLPLVRKAIGNLKPDIGSSAMERLNSMNLDTEWQDIENLVNSGVIPQAEKLKVYIQASCLKGNADKDIDKVISCIADILRIEEERYSPTEPMLLDILIAVESANSVQQLKAVFVGYP